MSGPSLRGISFEEIVEINRIVIASSGGLYWPENGNLLYPGSLEHVLEEIQGTIWGQELFPSLFQKAAAIAWRIICGHVFNDGNKRTAMVVCAVFLANNGYTLSIDMEVKEVALQIAKGEITFDHFVQWLTGRSQMDRG